MMELQKIYEEIKNDPANNLPLFRGFSPLYSAAATARIVIVGQAPGKKAQTTGIPWNDLSGNNLRTWLGLTREQFYNPNLVALLPMDFYYPGKGAHGDLPPRPEFAPKWHPRILAQLPDVRLYVLVGRYAQKYYLGKDAKKTLTDTVRAYREYLPAYFPLVHPSPLNLRWQTKNPWFAKEIVPALQDAVQAVLTV